MSGAPSIGATRAFFAPRAAQWDGRFPDDGAAYARAVADLGLPAGGRVLDAGCGTGRALPYLADAVGWRGTVVGVDATPEMLAAAAAAGRDASGALVEADARCLPLPAGSLDAAFAAGLLPHVAPVEDALAELARVVRRGGRLGLFHPVSRAALAARHGHDPDPDDPRAPHMIGPALTRTGWAAVVVDDGADRYLVVAVRV